MKKPTFVHGVMVAAVLAFVASAVIATVTPLVGFRSVAYLVVPALAFAYLLYLFKSTEERVGRISVLTLWSVFAIATWWFNPTLAIYLLLHVGAIWLVRSLYFYAGVFPSLLDLGLNVVSISAFGWAIERTGSIFLGIWCFFLVQALFVVIPKSFTKSESEKRHAAEIDRFSHAERQANQALQKLFSN